MFVLVIELDLRGYIGARVVVEDLAIYYSIGVSRCSGVIAGRGVWGGIVGGWGCVIGNVL